jgi:hypothetical protein
MPRAALDTQGPANRGYGEVKAELETRGPAVRETAGAQVRLLECEAADGRRVHVRVKTKTSGTWQASVASGSPNPVRTAVPTFWVFVDLKSSPRAGFVVPDECIRLDIHREHQAYLARNGGHRVHNDASQHHSIKVDRIEQWRGKWELLRSEVPTPCDS